MVEVDLRIDEAGTPTNWEGEDGAAFVKDAAVAAALALLATDANAALMVTRLTSILAAVTDPLNSSVDSVASVDAAEVPSLLSEPFTVTASGDTTLVPCPAGQQLRLRRILPTFDNTAAATMPRLALFLGATEVARGPVLSGRFDVTGDVDADLILNLSTTGTDVSGTIFYEVT